MLSSLPLLALSAIYFTSVTHAAPLPQSGIASNAPSGPPITSYADLKDVLGDLVIPQEQSENATGPTTTVKVRSPPASFDDLVEHIGDFRLPANITARSLAKVAR